MQNNASLVCVGRLDYSKGHDVLIKAMPFVVERFPDALLRIIGSGRRRNDLEEMVNALGVERNIVFVGSIKPKDVLIEFAQAYACVHPARIDNCPLVLVEAIATGTPVIASRTGGIPEIVKDGFNGFLFTPEDSQMLSESICAILASAQMRQKYSDNARKYFLSEFELKQGCKKIVIWLESQIQESEVS